MRGAPDIEYVRAAEAAAILARRRGHVLGVVAFGAVEALHPEWQPAPLWVKIPVLAGEPARVEIWHSALPVAECGADGIDARADGEVLFGAMRLPQPAGMSLEALSSDAYRRLFAFLDRQGYPHLLRAWNYLPRINEAEGELERYRCFNVGRHEAFAASGRGDAEEFAPAASVLGCSGEMAVYFFAGRTPGTPVDNPRQTAAYRYPEQYGPRTPLFVRAMRVGEGASRRLMISGTASIVGHETLHKGDLTQQGQEIARNIRALLEQARMEDTSRMALKVYVRHAQDAAAARALVEQEFGARTPAVYLHSDICRADLLLEIEAYCAPRA